MSLTAEPVNDAYLTVHEVADLARCEHKAVRRAIEHGHLTAYQPVRKLLIREQDARAWIESRATHTPSPRPAQPVRLRSRPRSGSVAALKALERKAGA